MRFPCLRAYFSGLVVVALLAGHVVYAQEIHQPTPKILKQRREEYQQAMEEWQNGDKNLEIDLHTKSREELLKRIDDEAARTKKLLESKQVYFGTLRSYYQEQYVRLESSTASGAKPPQSREELQEHIDSIGQEHLELQDRIKRTKDSSVQEKLLRQETALEDLQKNLQLQKALVERWERAEGGIAESRKAVLLNLQSIMDILQKQEGGSAETTAQMKRFYESMREAAGTPAKKAASVAVTVTINPATATLMFGKTQQFTARVSGGASGVRWTVQPAVGSISENGLYSAPPVASAQNVTVTAISIADGNARAIARVDLQPPADPPPPADISALTGNWVYITQPNLKTPASVQVALTERDGRMTGTLTANQVPKSVNLPPSVTFSFEGPKGGRLRWTLGKQSGVVEVIPAGPGKIELVWRNDSNAPIFDDFLSRLAAN